MIAEKFEVMARLGILNSRLKDFYDIWMLSRQYNFEGGRLAEAIRQTFEQRGTILVEPQEIFPESLSKKSRCNGLLSGSVSDLNFCLRTSIRPCSSWNYFYPQLSKP